MSTIPTVVASNTESDAVAVEQIDDWIVDRAIALLEQRIFNAQVALRSPADVRDYLRLKLTAEPNEIFAVVFLDTRLRVLAYEALFQGTIDETAIYPRVVVQRALAVNAAAVIFVRNHPSGVTEPSRQDRVITDRLKAALATVDVRVVDHFIVGKGRPFSFGENGLL